MDLQASDVFGNKEPLKNLIEDLNDIFPAQTPTPYDAHTMLMYRAGQRSVIEYLQTLLPSED